MASKPLIGITPTPSLDTLAHGTFERYTLNAAYANAVIAAGGIPLVLPFQNEPATALLDHFDGLILSGGADVDPARFGALSIHPATYGVSPKRDQFELDLLDGALRCDTPVLCICRGIQVLNVALGGTLVQDIPSEYHAAEPLPHRQQVIGIPANKSGHTVAVAEASLLHQHIGQTELPVNSFHHQAIDRIAVGLEIAARAPDGIVEAVVMPEGRFILGVQWHPELMFADHPAQLSLFEALTDAARVSQRQEVVATPH